MESSEYLRDSTDLPETSSGGLSPLSFTQPWSLRTSIEFQASPPRAVLQGTVESAGAELSFFFESEGDEAIKRYLGCALMFGISGEGVGEAFQSLADIFAYHYEQTHLLPPAGLITRRTEGKVVRSSTRPELEIGD